MLSAITCFVGYFPQGCIAHTMVAAKLQSRNTHTCTGFHSHSHAERDRDETNVMINKEHFREIFTESSLHSHSAGNSRAVVNHFSGAASHSSDLNAYDYIPGSTTLLIQLCRA